MLLIGSLKPRLALPICVMCETAIEYLDSRTLEVWIPAFPDPSSWAVKWLLNWDLG